MKFKILFLTLAMTLVLLIPNAFAVNPTEIFKCFDGVDTTPTPDVFIEHVSGANATLEGNAHINSTDCADSSVFSSCVDLDGDDDFINITSDTIKDFLTGGVYVTYVLDDLNAQDVSSSIFSISRPAPAENLVINFKVDNDNTFRFDIQEPSACTRRIIAGGATILVNEHINSYFQSSGSLYTYYENGTNISLSIESGANDGCFFGNSTIDLDTAISGISHDFNFRKRFDTDGRISQIIIFNATQNQENVTDLRNNIQTCSDLLGIAVVSDTQNPNFGESSINNSNPKINEVVLLSQVVQDETELSSYRFAENQTGNFINSTAFTISGTSVNATFNLTINQSRGTVIGFIWHTEDSSGNANTTAIDTFTIANTIPETPTILFPTSGLVTMSQPLDINVTFPADADSDTITISYYINGVLNQTSETNTTLNASDAIYILNVSISDGFDSSANTSVTFEIDTTNPIITSTLPANNSVHNANITVDLTCDNLNVFNFSYIFHNSSDIIQVSFNDTTGTTQSKLSQFIDTTGLGIGDYNLNISCTDNASNTDFEFLTLNFDNQAPVFSGLSINNTLANESDIISISVTCSDANLDTIEVQINSTGVFVTEESANVFPQTSIVFVHNETVIVGFISHQFICQDTLNQTSTSGLLNYTGLELPIIAVVDAIIFPLENAVTLIGIVALFLIILNILFKNLPSREARRNGRI